LLPPSLAVVPDESMELLTWSQYSLFHVIPTTALAIATNSRNSVTDLFSKSFVCFFCLQAMHPCQIPGNFQVVTNN
jgi:hypothetical protein